jgi:hypothetical protein
MYLLGSCYYPLLKFLFAPAWSFVVFVSSLQSVDPFIDFFVLPWAWAGMVVEAVG